VVNPCNQCSADVPPGAKFCPECGAAQGPRRCPACGALADKGRFCAECGTPIEGPAPEAVPAARKDSAPTAERRLTSIIFGDLVGFTTLSESRDAEEVRELLSRYFDEARVVVQRYGGTVEKFIGDAVMAVWGVPTTHEDDAQRAVRAGLELVQTVHALGVDIGLPDLDMRVGIVTGEVAVTLGATGEGMVAGDSVNTAARVQSAAAPGQVWVDEGTRALTSGSVEYDDVGEHALKGKAEPLHLFAARAVVAAIRGADRMDGLEAPLAGRDREMRLVKELFHTTEETGRPAVVVLQGEPGVGKSRLAWEFEKYINGLSTVVIWHRGRCLSYGEGVAFWALSEAVRVRLGLLESDVEPVVSEHLDRALAEIVPDAEERTWLRPRMAVLVGAASAVGFSREELFSAWTTFFERVGADQPVVLVIDDAQYADEALLDFLEHVLATARFGFFVLANARAGLLERRPSLVTTRGTTVIHVEPLGDADMAQVLDGLVAGLPEEARNRLVERAEGIPLFAVETIRALIDRDIVVPREGRYVLAAPDLDLTEIGAPASLQALIGARLDALSKDERRLVTDASVLGFSCTREGIEALVDIDDDLDVVLASLVRKQILSVQNDRFSAEFGQYRFVQAVVRQVAYETLSRRDRKSRHLQVAAHIAAQPDPADENAGVVAQHYLDAIDASAEGDPEVPELVRVATGLLERASARARSLGANAEAERYLLAAMTRADQPADIARLSESASEVVMNVGRYDEGIAYARSAVDLYAGIDDDIGVARATALQGRGLQASGKNAEALALIEPIWLKLPDRPDTVLARLRLARELAGCYLQTGRLDEAGRVQEQRILLAESLGDAFHLADALIGLGVVYGGRGAPRVGHTLLAGAAQLAREQDLNLHLCRALVNLAAQTLPYDVKAANRYSTESLAVASKLGVASWVNIAAANHALGLWTAGRLAELGEHLDFCAEQNVGLTEAPLLNAVLRWLSDATGEPLRSAPYETLDIDDENGLSWLAFSSMLDHQDAGELEAAASSGESCVQHALRASGIGDDFMHQWGPSVLAAVDTADFDAVDRLFAVVSEAPAGLVSPVVAAERLRVGALIAAVRDGDPAAVERDLLAAAGAFGLYGSPLARARTEEDLGRWLISVQRRDEAEAPLASARAAYTTLGANGWLARMDIESVVNA